MENKKDRLQREKKHFKKKLKNVDVKKLREDKIKGWKLHNIKGDYYED